MNVNAALKSRTENEKEQRKFPKDLQNNIEYFPTPRGEVQARVQVKAEKLVDLKFIRRLFIEHVSWAESQQIVKRMSDLLELLDADASGFVSWSSFSRVIQAVAPPQLLRADVTSFLEAQTDSALDLVDYREFIITGKVLIVERGLPTPENIPVASWLHRQNTVSGDKSTYTWKNHLEWYRNRKARAVIWLMRRAGRAVQYYKRVRSAKRFLQYAGVRAKAWSELMDVGYLGTRAFERRLLASQRLINRCLHARRYRQQVREAVRYLRIKANEVREQEVVATVGYDMPTGPSYGKIYQVYYARKFAIEFLRKKVAEATNYLNMRYEVLMSLVKLGNSVCKQVEVMDAVQRDLFRIGELAVAHSSRQDLTLMSLISLGREKALGLMERQEISLLWLLRKGRRALDFALRKDKVFLRLSKDAHETLEFCNRREYAYAFLVRRKTCAVTLLRRQREAIEYLRRISRNIWTRKDNMALASQWLMRKGKHAIEVARNQVAAYKRLKFVAQRAFAVTRMQTTAKKDLLEFGLNAKLQYFEKLFLAANDNRKKLKDEVRLITAEDKSRDVARSGISMEERWKVELADAFRYYATPADPVRWRGVNTDDIDLSELEIGRFGFQQLLLDGKLLGLPTAAVQECFGLVDYDGSGCVSFDELWNWFRLEARKRIQRMEGSRSNNQKMMDITLGNIITAQKRALWKFMKVQATAGGSAGGGVVARSVTRGSSVAVPQAAENATPAPARRSIVRSLLGNDGK
eukprot:gene821-913_t